MYQLGLCERELNNVLYGVKQAEKKVIQKSQSANGRGTIKQKEIEEDDVCPICQEDICKRKNNLTFCRYDMVLHNMLFYMNNLFINSSLSIAILISNPAADYNNVKLCYF